MGELRDLDDVFLSVLERLVVRLLDVYPRLSARATSAAHLSLASVCMSLHRRGDVLPPFFSRVSYQALLRICSRTMADLEQSDDHGLVNDEYVKLFTSLLNINLYKGTSFSDFPHSERVNMFRVLYDETVRSILRLIGKLDLGTSVPAAGSGEDTGDPEGVSADPTAHISASKPKDFQVFINLVAFCCEFLPNCRSKLFQRWMYLFTNEMISHSLRWPLVSGFYRLLQLGLQIGQDQGYFETITVAVSVSAWGVEKGQEEEEEEDELTSDDGGSEAEKDLTIELIRKFVAETCVRLQQYKVGAVAWCLIFSCCYFVLLRFSVVAVVAAVVAILYWR